MELIERVMIHLKKRRKNIIEGNVNCIPSPFPTFRTDFVGTEQETYYIVTGQQKSGKTKWASFVFIYNNILYAYHNPDKVRIKTFYVPLEETQEKITMRFMCFLLFEMSNHKIRIDVKELESTNEGRPVSQEILDLLESEEYQKILTFFEDSIIWVGETNPTGIYKRVVKYACEHGKRYDAAGRDMDSKEKGDSFDYEDDAFDHYVPDDPNEYVQILVDHASLISTESGMDLRGSIKKLSLYLNEVKNKYHYIPILIQQQSVETQNLEAFKANKIRPTAAGLADCKDTKNDCNVMIGLTNPYYHELSTYLGYNILKLRDHQRFAEVVLNRDGSANTVKALYFDGAVSYFNELPGPQEEAFLLRVYAMIDEIKRKATQAVSQVSFLMFRRNFVKNEDN